MPRQPASTPTPSTLVALCTAFFTSIIGLCAGIVGFVFQSSPEGRAFDGGLGAFPQPHTIITWSGIFSFLISALACYALISGRFTWNWIKLEEEQVARGSRKNMWRVYVLLSLAGALLICLITSISGSFDALGHTNDAAVTDIAKVHWSALIRSTTGHSLLEEIQGLHDCCGFESDTDMSAQPCKSSGSGENLPGCKSALVNSIRGSMSTLFWVALVNSLLVGATAILLAVVMKDVLKRDKSIQGLVQ